MPTAEELKNTMLRMPSVKEMNPKLDKVVEETEKIAYAKSVIERIKKFATSGEIEVGGVLKKPDNYCDENNVEYQKYLYFFRCIDFNLEICELILHPKANATRAAIQETPLANLMIESLK